MTRISGCNMADLTTSIYSQWYPYKKVQAGFYDLTQAANIPRKVMDYLLDMPDEKYTPIDDNRYARTLLWKYLYYDEAHPEEQPLPTPQQKMSVLFNPDEPTKPPTDKGYRLYPQIFVLPSQTDGQTRIYCYMGRMIATSDFEVQLSVVFDVWTNYKLQANTKSVAYSRVDAITYLLMQAFHGVNMAGVGTFYFNRSKHGDCGSSIFDDGKSNVGRRLVLGLSVASETPNGPLENNTWPMGGNFFVK